MRRWIAGVLVTVLTLSSTVPSVRAQSAPLVGGGLTQLASPIYSDLLQNGGFETVAGSVPSSWSPAGTWGIDQLVKHSGNYSYRLSSAGAQAMQKLQVKAGVYRLSGWIKTQSGGSGSARFTLDSRPGGISEWSSSADMSGTNDWTYQEILVTIATDRTVGVTLDGYYAAAGFTAWYDDVKLEMQQPYPVSVFMLYPNYRGMLFDDGPSTMKFDVTVTPPAGDFGRYNSVQAMLKDEGTGQVVATQSYPTSAHFVAQLDGGAMQVGHSYLATFSLMDGSSSSATYSYPAFRVSRVAAATRSTMNVSFDAKNRVLLKGTPRFILGVYDSGMGYANDAATYETMLWSPTGDRRMGGMNINMYLNYWYGDAPTTAMNALMTNLQSHGVTYLQTGNCFDHWPADPGFQINASDSYVQTIGAHAANAGFYTIDECITSLVPGAFTQYDRLRRLAPASITFSANFGNSDLMLWRDSADVISTDPYPMFGAEPSGGYNHGQVAAWTNTARQTVMDSRPIMTVLQFFKFNGGRYPTLAEMRAHAYMSIVEGAKGLFWWSLGDNALLAVCSGWCDERTGYMTNLKSVVNELAALEPALLADDAPTALTGNSNGAIKTKVKVVDGKGYVFAYNSTNTTQNATFTWNTAPGTVTVNAESRTLSASGNSFSDSFGPFAAHAYLIGSGGTSTPPPTPSNPTLSFTAPAANTTVSGTAAVTLAASGGSGSGYTYSLKVDGTAVSGTGPSYSWDTTTVADGTHTLAATVTDSAGGSGTASLSVTVRNTKPSPTVAFAAPAANATLSSTASVTLAASGGSGSGYTYRLKADGTAVSGTGPSYSWDTTTVANGAHTLSATVTDSAGMSGTATLTVNVNNVAATPTVTFTAPAANATVTGTTNVTVSASTGGTLSAATTSAATTYNYGLKVDGTAIAGTGPSFSWDTTKVANGTHTLTATATDGTGATGTATQTVTVSNAATTPPTTGTLKVFITQPTAGATVSGTAWAVMWLEGSTAATKTYSLTLGGKPMLSQTTSSNGPVAVPFDTRMVADGTQPLTATVKDSNNNSGTATINVNAKNGITSSPTPTLTAAFTSPSSGATLSSVATIGMSVSGSTAASRTFTLAVDGSSVSSQTVSGSTASYALDTTKLSNASHTLSLTVTDTAGGSATATLPVSVSNAVPLTAAFSSPGAGATLSGATTIGMSTSGGSTSSTSRTFTLAVDGSTVSTQSVSGTSASYSLDTTTLSNAAHTLSLTVTDGAGGSATATRSVTVANTVTSTPSPAPTGTIKVYITQPTGGSVGGTAWVIIWLDNAAAGNKTYTMTAGGRTVWSSSNSDRPASLPWNTTLTSNGATTLTVNVSDATGNTGSSTVNVTVAN
jgi:hypothetical protein